MRIAVLDDDRMEWRSFTEALHGWDPTRHPECFADGASLLEAAKTCPAFTVAFLDVYLPNENGVEVAGRLHGISPETEVVFTTTSREHAVQAFAVGAVHYLVKPVTTEGIREAFARIAKKSVQANPTLVLKIGHGSRIVCLNKIIRLNSAAHRVELMLDNGEILSAYTTLGELQEQLDRRFLQIQRGLIVNMEYIEMMQADRCRLCNGETMLLSRRERARIRETYNSWIFRHLPADRG
ncbi:MAG TPA: LytTR family DNA-binding domain-containing protein [Firmicutes bacterium]|nr:LytTR family DNA-binding domain-containing protein [Bacillota bacterium]